MGCAGVARERALAQSGSTRANTDAGDGENLDSLHVDIAAPQPFDPSDAIERKERPVLWALLRTKGRVREATELIGAHRNTVLVIKVRLVDVKG
jgi:hypothetical protein